MGGQSAADPGEVPSIFCCSRAANQCVLGSSGSCPCLITVPAGHCWGCFLGTAQFLLTVDSKEKMGKEGGNKEEETGREPVSLILAADQVERKNSLSVPHSRATSTSSPPHERKISLRMQYTDYCV